MYVRKLLPMLILFLIGSAMAGETPPNNQIVQGMNTVSQGSNHHNKAQLLEGRGMLERIHLSNPDDVLPLYYLTYAEYELIRFGMIEQESGLYEKFVDATVNHAKEVLKRRPEWSEGLALLANIYGIQITQSWIKGATLGPEANELAERAVKSDSTNPRAWLVHGIMKFNTPAFFGGSVEQALVDFQRAMELFDHPVQSESLNPSWGYIETFAWLGKAFEKTEDPNAAIAAYKKALEIDPEFSWVKRVLLPALDKKIAEQSTE